MTLAREHSGSAKNRIGAAAFSGANAFARLSLTALHPIMVRKAGHLKTLAKRRMFQGETRFAPGEMSSARAKGQAAGQTVSY